MIRKRNGMYVCRSQSFHLLELSFPCLAGLATRENQIDILKTVWGDLMAVVLQKIFSISFYRIRIVVFQSKFHRSLFLWVQLTMSQHWSENGLVPNKWQAIAWPNDDLVRGRTACFTQDQWVEIRYLNFASRCVRFTIFSKPRWLRATLQCLHC